MSGQKRIGFRKKLPSGAAVGDELPTAAAKFSKVSCMDISCGQSSSEPTFENVYLLARQ